MNNKNSLLTRFLIIFATILITALPTQQASAALRSCRTDPIFQLSNGDKLTVVLNISTTDTNIRNVTYTLHVPAGVTVTRVTYTAGGIGTKEVYKVVQDGTAKTYKTDILVTTQNTGTVAIVATAKLNTTYTGTASGSTGVTFSVSVSKP